MNKILHDKAHKLGSAKAKGERVERSRIWLQGQWLAQAGFKPGAHYDAVWKDGRLTLRLWEDGIDDVHERRTVSGKGDVPIIDIVGARVRDTFTAGFVQVVATSGRIVITEAQ